MRPTTAPRTTAKELPTDEFHRCRHLRLGWWMLLVFLVLGLVLETLHGFKVQWYLSRENETRRFMWTLGHAHGTLLGLVNLAFAWTAQTLGAWSARTRALASSALVAGSVLMPVGFLLGGMFVNGGDPGLGILLVPVGGGLLALAVGLTAIAVARRNGPTAPQGRGEAGTKTDRAKR